MAACTLGWDQQITKEKEFTSAQSNTSLNILYSLKHLQGCLFCANPWKCITSAFTRCVIVSWIESVFNLSLLVANWHLFIRKKGFLSLVAFDFICLLPYFLLGLLDHFLIKRKERNKNPNFLSVPMRLYVHKHIIWNFWQIFWLKEVCKGFVVRI